MATDRLELDMEGYASQVIVFYASFLADAVGPTFVAPALDVFTDYWLDASSESVYDRRFLRILMSPCHSGDSAGSSIALRNLSRFFV